MTFLIILDGAEELPARRPPSAVLRAPRLARLMRGGVVGRAAFFVPGREVDSLSCILTMLGVPPGRIPAGRAPIEALGAGIAVGGGLVYRCNVVRETEGRLIAPGGMSRAELAAFAGAAARLAPPGIGFFHLSDYRNLLLRRGGEASSRPPVTLPPPHQHRGEKLSGLLEGIGADPALAQFIEKSRRIRPGYLLYPWGGGRRAPLLRPEGRIGSAACVCAAEVMAGIARALGMEVCRPSRATGDADTDLRQKAEAALRLSARFDTVILHINGTDELAHRQDRPGKLRLIERIDAELLGPLLDGIGRDARFLITSDHVTSSETGRHERQPVRWLCADYRPSAGVFTPPPTGGARPDRRLFERLLREPASPDAAGKGENGADGGDAP